ncbi:MAG: hypothetical protein MPJ24_05845 [Pirellulaceae bacterium]|nr:hypothetical protein [Pirellulaceae bacterium]
MRTFATVPFFLDWSLMFSSFPRVFCAGLFLLGVTTSVLAASGDQSNDDCPEKRLNELSRRLLAEGSITLPTNHLERELWRDLQDNHLDSFSLLEGALIASHGGCTLAELDEAKKIFSTILQQQRNEFEAEPRSFQGDDFSKAKKIFDRMFQNVLTGTYRAHNSDLYKTLTEGDYNCVTSSVVFALLAEREGLPVVWEAQPGHLRCFLIGSSPLPIETTCVDWFSQWEASRTKGQDHFSFSGVDTNIGRMGTPNEPIRRFDKATEVLATIYYNRGLCALQEQDFSQATFFFCQSLFLAPDDPQARLNLLATLNNRAIRKVAEKKYAQGATLLKLGREYFPDYEPFVTNDLYLHEQWIHSLIFSKDHRFAQKLINECQRRYSDRPALFVEEEGYLLRAEPTSGKW